VDHLFKNNFCNFALDKFVGELNGFHAMIITPVVLSSCNLNNSAGIFGIVNI
jgi:hypothetical protein